MAALQAGDTARASTTSPSPSLRDGSPPSPPQAAERAILCGLLSLSARHGPLGGGEGRGEVGDRRKFIPLGRRRPARRTARAVRAQGGARPPRSPRSALP